MVTWFVDNGIGRGEVKYAFFTEIVCKIYSLQNET